MKKNIKQIWFALVRNFVFFIWKIFPPKVKQSAKQHILILRLDGIGDTVLFSGCFEWIRKKFPDAKISVIVRDYVGELLEFCPFIDEIIPWNENTFTWNPFYRLNFMRRIASHQYDVLLNPLWTHTEEGNDMCRLLQARNLYMFPGKNCLPQIRNKKNATVAEVPQDVVLEYEKYGYFLRAMGIEITNEEIFPTVFSSPDASKRIETMLAQNIPQPFVAIVPGAGTQNKIWALQKWVEIVNRFISETEYDLVLLGGKNDAAYCEKINSQFDTARIKNYTAQFSLTEISEIIRRATMYVGSDTGMVHIAAATGTPTVCIMGGGHFGRFFPYGDYAKNRIAYQQMDCYNCNWVCKYESIKCIEEISVDTVWNEVENSLKKISSEKILKYGISSANR